MGPWSHTPELRHHLFILGLARDHPFHGRDFHLESCTVDCRHRLPGHTLPDLPVLQAPLVGHILCRIAS